MVAVGAVVGIGVIEGVGEGGAEGDAAAIVSTAAGATAAAGEQPAISMADMKINISAFSFTGLPPMQELLGYYTINV